MCDRSVNWRRFDGDYRHRREGVFVTLSQKIKGTNWSAIQKCLTAIMLVQNDEQK